LNKRHNFQESALFSSKRLVFCNSANFLIPQVFVRKAQSSLRKCKVYWESAKFFKTMCSISLSFFLCVYFALVLCKLCPQNTWKEPNIVIIVAQALLHVPCLQSFSTDCL
jgi:hypothetical protein